jgi:hypothetical protein
MDTLGYGSVFRIGIKAKIGCWYFDYRSQSDIMLLLHHPCTQLAPLWVKNFFVMLIGNPIHAVAMLRNVWSQRPPHRFIHQKQKIIVTFKLRGPNALS